MAVQKFLIFRSIVVEKSKHDKSTLEARKLSERIAFRWKLGKINICGGLSVEIRPIKRRIKRDVVTMVPERGVIFAIAHICQTRQRPVLRTTPLRYHEVRQNIFVSVTDALEGKIMLINCNFADDARTSASSIWETYRKEKGLIETANERSRSRLNRSLGQ